MQKIDAKAQIIANMTQERYEAYVERLAILIYDAKIPEKQAEILALRMMQNL